jgi:hypothetical protein
MGGRAEGEERRMKGTKGEGTGEDGRKIEE